MSARYPTRSMRWARRHPRWTRLLVLLLAVPLVVDIAWSVAAHQMAWWHGGLRAAGVVLIVCLNEWHLLHEEADEPNDQDVAGS